MKLFATLLVLISLTACSKKAQFDGNKGGGNPTGTGAGVDTESPAENDPVSTEAYKETIVMEADISYSAKVKVGNNDSTLPIRNEGFKIPQTLTVTQGWAGRDSTATISLKVVGMSDIVCTYKSNASVSHNNPYNSQAEYQNGLVYSFSNCTNSLIDPTVVVDAFDRIVLNVVKADDLETKTVVKADIKLYQ